VRVLERTGYHSRCYQYFPGNLHHLGDEFEPEASNLLLHSPLKHSAGPVFPPEYIFCEKVEIKGVDRKTERAIISSWKNKENAWEQIESRAEKMSLFRLHRLVRSTDLFAVEAKHHPSCLRSFRTSFANYERGINRAKEPKNTEHDHMSAAHEKALVSVWEHIQTHVIQQNEVLWLSSLCLLYIEELKRNGTRTIALRNY
jgi:hypothetical protein